MTEFSAVPAYNPLYLERATRALREADKLPVNSMLRYLSPLDWEHNNLTWNYVWRQGRNSLTYYFFRILWALQPHDQKSNPLHQTLPSQIIH